ncbi:MAG TPA: transcriptional regulator [Lentisphaeria bacterium]|nr:MAG: transcriptional regulator [Lentisphaerae bacterium GWF2_38_69]HBM17114.1 transcriptional regulator [Lentisphaeria bacterium]
MEKEKLKKTILLIEDDRNTRNGVFKLLNKKYDVTVAEDGIRGINVLQRNSFDLILSDIQMPGATGMDVLAESMKMNPAPPCVLITAYGSIETAVGAIKAGAYDFVSKPIDVSRLELIIERALESKELKEENTRLKKQLNEKFGVENIIGKSSKMAEIIEFLKQIAPARSTILITGESGTGKELIAQSIHTLSGRKGPFVPVHCAALPSNLLESELFGHERGAFTGASERRKGRFELADGGTIFLDEIGEIDQVVQVKLLRILETRIFERVGGSESIQTDSRIVAATNRNLQEMVQKGEFREDLYFRLNVLNIELPPLRQRKDDVPLLSKSFIDFYSRENGKKIEGISAEAMNFMQSYDWPGNIRELRNCIERMVVLSRESILQVSLLPASIREKVMPGSGKIQILKSIDALDIESNEKKLILKALDETHNNKTAAADKLGISRRTLHRKLNEYGINH